MKPGLFALLLIAIFTGPLHARQAAPPPPQTAATHTGDELLSLLHIGAAKIEQHDWESAEMAFRQSLASPATPAQYLEALLGLARTYRLKGDLTKACAVYERIVADYPDNPVLPTVYLELGRSLRALGAYRLALNRFYNVINSTLKLPEEGANRYRQLARTAQFEVAETYFQSGDYDQASRFFTRLTLLGLAPADRARASFKSAYALTLKGDHEKSTLALQNFLALCPGDENAPEARYLLAIELRRIGRTQESLATVLELLRIEKNRPPSAVSSKTWAYWQQRTGNQLANEFYEQGDTGSALVIYQALLDLNPAPSWRLPVFYQIGLCQERLRQPERARAAYQSILDSLLQTPGSGDKLMNLDDLATMAGWRLKSLDWQDATVRQVATFLTPAGAPPASATP